MPQHAAAIAAHNLCIVRINVDIRGGDDKCSKAPRLARHAMRNGSFDPSPRGAGAATMPAASNAGGFMKTLRKSAGALAVVCIGIAAGGAWAAPAQGLAELLQRLPEPPATAEEAARWVDKSGALKHPGLLALKADIEAHQRAAEAILEAGVPAQQAQAAQQHADLAKGMAQVGIDMNRMQSDPAYAQAVQARMKSMSPVQLMAMSRAMAQPMNDNPNRRNAAADMANDAPAVKAAAEAGFAYSQQQVARVQAHHARWQATEADVKSQVFGTPLKVDVPKPRIEFDNPGCDKACTAGWDAYAARMVPLMVARDTQALKLRRDALHRERQALAPTVAQADKAIKAAQYGEKALSDAHTHRIVGYDVGMLGEVGLLVTKTEEIARIASRSVHCGKQAVQVPGAVCQ
jgi:hypothetical protein